MKEKESFVFYRSFKVALSDLSDSDKLVMYEAISDYALDRNEPKLEGFPKALFSLIKPQLDANWKRYKAGVENGHKGKEYGKLGGRPKKEKTLKKPSINPLLTLTEPANVNDNVNDNVNEKDIKEKSKRFVPPSPDEVKKYCSERNNKVDPEKFRNFYEMKGWMVGKNKMKDWKAAIRTWEKREDEGQVSKTGKQFKNFNDE